MGTLPPTSGRASSTPLEDSLVRWERAGLIDAGQRRRIRAFESAAAAGPAFDGSGAALGPATPTRPSGTELLAYLGVLVALAGVVTLVYAAGATLALIAALTMAIGLIALAAAREFQRRGGDPAARAAGACLALGAAAVGAAAGEFSSAASVFTRTVVTRIACGAPSTPCPTYTSTDQSGNVLVGAAIVVAISMVVLRFVPGRMVAVVAVVASYVGASATINVAQLSVDRSPETIALVLVAVSVLLIGVGETLHARQKDVSGFFGFVGVVGATIPLYLIGNRSGVHVDVLAGGIAVVALAAGIVVPRRGVAYGAVIGVAGLIIDIGARNFTTPTSLGVFFSVAGIAAVAALAAATRVRNSRRLGRAGRVAE
jgi:hypothetical protein